MITHEMVQGKHGEYKGAEDGPLGNRRGRCGGGADGEAVRIQSERQILNTRQQK